MDNNEQLQTNITKDYARDTRSHVRFQNILIICLCGVISLLIIGFVITTINNQNKLAEVANHATEKMVELLTEYDWQVEYEIESTNNEFMSGNITVEK